MLIIFRLISKLHDSCFPGLTAPDSTDGDSGDGDGGGGWRGGGDGSRVVVVVGGAVGSGMGGLGLRGHFPKGIHVGRSVGRPAGGVTTIRHILLLLLPHRSYRWRNLKPGLAKPILKESMCQEGTGGEISRTTNQTLDLAIVAPLCMPNTNLGTSSPPSRFRAKCRSFGRSVGRPLEFFLSVHHPVEDSFSPIPQVPHPFAFPIFLKLEALSCRSSHCTLLYAAQGTRNE